MSLNNIKDKKKRTEAEILKKITEYEKETNTKVKNVDITRTSRHNIITSINLKTNL